MDIIQLKILIIDMIYLTLPTELNVKKTVKLLPLRISRKQTDMNFKKNLHYVCDEYTHYLGNMFNNHGT